ncbi:YgaP-like transmembrane domain [Pseudomonas viridiflava]|uniref:Cye/dehydrase n=1 Tax=Pseudomonas viridiflava TaxID=33069 RepID=A0A3M5NZP9_PSEVI|nr:YgaP-like transmembrane domain [Pseudomonas viridiflava]RMT77213.1 Cye/dehydrase [Pseudomonas viridiflava]
MNQSPLVAVKSTTWRVNHPDLKTTERVVSIAAGSLLLVTALRRGGLIGLLGAAAGAYGVLRGVSGRCAVKRKLASTPFEHQFQNAHGWKASEAISRSVTIGKPMSEIRAFLEQPQNIGPLIPWVDSIEAIDTETSRWTVRGPLGRTLNWTLQRSPSSEHDSLHWQTLPAGKWQHNISASLKPAPGNRGTELKVIVVCEPSGGDLGHALAKAISAFSDKALLNLLSNLKQQLETGEVSTNQMRASEVRDFMFLHGQATDASASSPEHEQPDVMAVQRSQPQLERGNA